MNINDIGPNRDKSSGEPNKPENNHHDAENISKKVTDNAILSTRTLCSRITRSG
jgi:hypothetical protein